MCKRHHLTPWNEQNRHRLLVFMLWIIWRKLTSNSARAAEMATTLQTGNLCRLLELLKDQTFLALPMKLNKVELHSGRPISHIILQICKKYCLLETSRQESSCSTMCPKVATQYFRLKVKCSVGTNSKRWQKFKTSSRATWRQAPNPQVLLH